LQTSRDYATKRQFASTGNTLRDTIAAAEHEKKVDGLDKADRPVIIGDEHFDELLCRVIIEGSADAVQIQSQEIPTGAIGTSEMKDKSANLRKNEQLLEAEGLKLQRIEDEVEYAEVELFVVDESTDAAEKSRVIANIERLRDEKTLCLIRQDTYHGFINTLKDMIAATEQKISIDAFNAAAWQVINED
jgi:hypothetical protein